MDEYLRRATATVSWREVRRDGDFVFCRRGTGETGWWHDHGNGEDYGGEPHGSHQRVFDMPDVHQGVVTSQRNSKRVTKMINLKKAFKEADGEYLKFDRIENPLHPRPDICAFLKLHELVPGKGHDIVAAAEHDEIYLDVSPEDLAAVATQEDIVYLYRCGVRISSETDSLAMFV